MQGYRTILFNLIMLVGSIVGAHSLDPDTINKYVDAIVLLWGGGNFVLRFITSTAIGQKVAPLAPLPPGTKIGAILAGFLMLGSLQACQTVSNVTGQDLNAQTPAQKLLAVEYGYAGALLTMTNLVDTGVIKSADVPILQELIHSASSSIDAAETAVKNGQDSTSLISAAQVALTRLLTYLETKQNGKRTSGDSGSFSPTRPYPAGYAICWSDLLGAREGTCRGAGYHAGGAGNSYRRAPYSREDAGGQAYRPFRSGRAFYSYTA
jgi:hypothetical protein